MLMCPVHRGTESSHTHKPTSQLESFIRANYHRLTALVNQYDPVYFNERQSFHAVTFLPVRQKHAVKYMIDTLSYRRFDSPAVLDSSVSHRSV